MIVNATEIQRWKLKWTYQHDVFLVKRQNENRMHHPQPRSLMVTKKKCGMHPADTFRLPPLNLNRIGAGGGGGGGGGGNGANKTRRNSTLTTREPSLLGDLHVDKLYLQKLLENPG